MGQLSLSFCSNLYLVEYNGVLDSQGYFSMIFNSLLISTYTTPDRSNGIASSHQGVHSHRKTFYIKAFILSLFFTILKHSKYSSKLIARTFKKHEHK